MADKQTSMSVEACRERVARYYLADEQESTDHCLSLVDFTPAQQQRIHRRAAELVVDIRRRRQVGSGLDAFLAEYDLSTDEGIVLMCLAEALLRIPDHETADRLIHDKLAHADWQRHLGQASSLLVNAGTWGLLLGGRLTALNRPVSHSLTDTLGRIIGRSGEPVIRLALKQAMKILGQQFVMGRTIEEAWQRSRQADYELYRFSFDMLGEAALSQADADEYFTAYQHAITVLAAQARETPDPVQAPGISIKLSALHPRFEPLQADRVRRELVPKVIELARLAAQANIGLTIDAEEAERLEPTLDVFAAVSADTATSQWQGLGLAVQAYQKRAPAVIDWLAALGRQHGRRYLLRLVKGAYWDTEIKLAQIRGLAEYPVFTRKQATDVSYLACAARLLHHHDVFFAQFATHNAHTVAAIMELGGSNGYEFQRLHGMGDALYRGLFDRQTEQAIACRVYAPVGAHHRLLPYLVRRLLENGANSSFVNRLAHDALPVDALIADPLTALRDVPVRPPPGIPLPAHLYGPGRINSAGINYSDINELNKLIASLQSLKKHDYTACPIVNGRNLTGTAAREVVSPADHADRLGHVTEAGSEIVSSTLDSAAQAAPDWAATAADVRAATLERAALLFEKHHAELIALLVREAGRCLVDSINEVREAVDYCRYYAAQTRKLFAGHTTLPGPTGESNELSLHGRGVFVTISPWNFPLAIFCGQITAALAAGNAVIAKPASQTTLIGARAIGLLHEAGVPADVLHFLPGKGSVVGDRLVSDPRVDGVAFTGSTATARHINRSLAGRDTAIVPLIAETGGVNAMIVDSSALPEQFVPDVLLSAFNSAGQRCSALRVLFVQEEIADHSWQCLTGAMAQLRIGDPAVAASDIGPLIDDEAVAQIQTHCRYLRSVARRQFELALPDNLPGGSYLAPCVYEIDSLHRVQGEVFGPVLHVIRYQARALDEVIASINACGYGLTLGIHTRIEETARYIRRHVRVGNTYVNRNMIGAVVGVQPFGGEGLSGTGPKAGGPNYLQRFAVERACSVNTAAVGGNATLLSSQGGLRPPPRDV